MPEHVERGTSTGRARITCPQGTYGYDVDVLVSPFVLEPSDRTVVPGQTVTLMLTSAEPLEGKPTLTVKQPGMDERPLRKVSRLCDPLQGALLRAAWRGRREGHRERDRDRHRRGTQTQRLREMTLQ